MHKHAYLCNKSLEAELLGQRAHTFRNFRCRQIACHRNRCSLLTSIYEKAGFSTFLLIKRKVLDFVFQTEKQKADPYVVLT